MRQRVDGYDERPSPSYSFPAVRPHLARARLLISALVSHVSSVLVLALPEQLRPPLYESSSASAVRYSAVGNGLESDVGDPPELLSQSAADGRSVSSSGNGLSSARRRGPSAAVCLSCLSCLSCLCASVLFAAALLLLESQAAPAARGSSSGDGQPAPLSAASRRGVSGRGPALVETRLPAAQAGSSSRFTAISRFSFAPAAVSASAPRLLSVHWADINAEEDSCPDLFVLISSSPSHSSASSSPVSVLRLLSACPVAGTAAVFRTLPEASEQLSSAGSSAVAVDVDGDYRQDLLVTAVASGGGVSSDASACADGCSASEPASASRCAASSSVFSLQLPACSQPGCAREEGGAPLALDWDQDGLLDVMVGENVGGYAAAMHSVSALPATGNESSGCLPTVVSRNVLQGVSGCLVSALAFLDLDSRPELLCFGSLFPSSLLVFHLANQRPAEAVSSEYAPVAVSSAKGRKRPVSLHHRLRDACLADINGDGQDDYVLATAHSGLVLWLSIAAQSPLRYSSHRILTWQQPEPDTAASVACIDADNDGDIDVLVLYDTANQTASISSALFHNQRTGPAFLQFAYSLPQTAAEAAGALPSSVAVADFNSDGFVDLLLADASGFSLYRNDAPASASAHWLTVSFWGLNGATSTLGDAALAELRLPAEEGGEWDRVVRRIAHPPSAGLQPYSQHHRRLHIGVGRHLVLSRVDIRWPRSHKAERLQYDSLAADQHLHALQLNTMRLGRLMPPALQQLLSGYELALSRCVDAAQRRLQPSIFVIGNWKCGTTSLARSLEAHPLVLPPANKELHYFNTLAADLPMAWYLQLFPCGGEKQRTYDATASYFFSAETPRRLLSAFPHALLLLLLRDPVDRAFSHYRMNLAQLAQQTTIRGSRRTTDLGLFHSLVVREIDSFMLCAADGQRQQRPLLFSQLLDPAVVPAAVLSRCAESTSDNVLRPGLYSVFLQRWLAELGPGRRQQLMLVATEQLELQPERVMAAVQAFTGLPAARGTVRKANVKSTREFILNSTRQLLQRFYRPFNAALAHMLPFHNEYVPSWLHLLHGEETEAAEEEGATQQTADDEADAMQAETDSQHISGTAPELAEREAEGTRELSDAMATE